MSLGFRRQLGTGLARFLSRPRAAQSVIHGLPGARLIETLRPGDVLLVEGDSRIATGIKYLTQSTWSHAALFVGPLAMPEARIAVDDLLP